MLRLRSTKLRLTSVLYDPVFATDVVDVGGCGWVDLEPASGGLLFIYCWSVYSDFTLLFTFSNSTKFAYEILGLWWQMKLIYSWSYRFSQSNACNYKVLRFRLYLLAHYVRYLIFLKLVLIVLLLLFVKSKRVLRHVLKGPPLYFLNFLYVP